MIGDALKQLLGGLLLIFGMVAVGTLIISSLCLCVWLILGETWWGAALVIFIVAAVSATPGIQIVRKTGEK